MRKIGTCDSDLLTVLLAYSHMLKACLKSVFDGILTIIIMLASNFGNILIVTRCP